MTPEVRTDLRELIAGHRVWYEVRPYYVVVEHRPLNAPTTETKIQAGYDVSLYAVLDSEQFELDRDERARLVRSYFESTANQIQSAAGQHCTVEVMPYADSVILDPHNHFQPEAMLQIRISHCRGLDQPAGAPEDQALAALNTRLHDLGITLR